MKKLSAAICALLVFLLAASPAFACTAVYVGKEASVDGTIMLGRSNDVHPTVAPTMIQVVDRVENQPGSFYSDDWGFSYPLPDTTYKYTAIPISTSYDSFTIDAAGTCNEYGVAVSATVTAYTCGRILQADPCVDGGLCEDSIAGILAACSKTSREAAELLCSIVDEYGSGERNIVMIADRNEAWYVEIYSGHQYCAVRMPDDCVAAFGNEFMLTEVDPDSPDVICSKDLFYLPESHGYAKYNENGSMNLFDTYAGEGRLNDYANLRTWTGHQLLAPSTAGEYDTYTNYPLFFKPDEKVGLQDVFAVFRNRFEGTDYCPDETGSISTRVIGIETQAHVHVLQVYPDMPADKSCVSWVTLSQAEFAPFLPVSNAVTKVSEAYSTDFETNTYTPESAWFVYKGLNTLCAGARERVKPVGQYWRVLERGLVGAMPQIIAQDPQTITDMTLHIQDTALADAQVLYNDVLTNIMLSTDTCEYPFSYSSLSLGNAPRAKSAVEISLRGSMCESRYGLNDIGKMSLSETASAAGTEAALAAEAQTDAASAAGTEAVLAAEAQTDVASASGTAAGPEPINEEPVKDALIETVPYVNGTGNADISTSQMILLAAGALVLIVCGVLGKKK